jgi:hypothetical protein
MSGSCNCVMDGQNRHEVVRLFSSLVSIAGDLALAKATPAATRLAWCSKRIDDDTGTRTGDGRRIAAEHGNARAELGATERNHVLAECEVSLV